MISGLLENLRASLIAHSTASAPLLARKVFVKPLGAIWISLFKSSDRLLL
jgi:hypothetical protein